MKCGAVPCSSLPLPESEKRMKELLAAPCVIKLVQLGQGAFCSQEHQARGGCWHGNPSQQGFPGASVLLTGDLGGGNSPAVGRIWLFNSRSGGGFQSTGRGDLLVQMRNLMCCECTVASLNLIIKIPAVKEWPSRNVSVINASVSRDGSWGLENCLELQLGLPERLRESATGREAVLWVEIGEHQEPSQPLAGFLLF